MGLADLLIAKQQGGGLPGDEGYVDNIGLAFDGDPEDLKENIDYIVARIMLINEQNVRSGKDTRRLYLRGRDIYLGHDKVTEDYQTIYSLSKVRFHLKTWMRSQIWDRLRELLPEISNDKVVIDRHHAYDKVTGEIEYNPDGFMTVQ